MVGSRALNDRANHYGPPCTGVKIMLKIFLNSKFWVGTKVKKCSLPQKDFGPIKIFLTSKGPPSIPALFGKFLKVSCACSLLCFSYSRYVINSSGSCLIQWSSIQIHLKSFDHFLTSIARKKAKFKPINYCMRIVHFHLNID